MDPDDITFRPASATDVGLLRRALLQNANAVRPGSVDADELDTTWRYRRYVDGFPGAHDFGVVAERDGRPVGIVWTRFSSEGDPAPGWVDGDIPDDVDACIDIPGMKKATSEQIKAAFTRLDANKDGKLSLQEYLPPS